jgi:hypothetical protein
MLTLVGWDEFMYGRAMNRTAASSPHRPELSQGSGKAEWAVQLRQGLWIPSKRIRGNFAVLSFAKGTNDRSS